MLKEIEYKELVENDYNPRKRFDDAAMQELVDSIRKVGLLESLVVRSKKNNGGAPYEVICGIRRYRALGQIKNGEKIPVNQVKVDDKQAKILSISENTARQNLSPVEEGKAYANYLQIDFCSSGTKLPSHGNPDITELSKHIGVGEETISRRVSLLFLPEDIQNMIENNILPTRKAESIVRLRQISDEKVRHQKMREFANKAKDFTSDDLASKISNYLENLKEETEKEGELLKEYEENERKAKMELITTYDEIYKWIEKNEDNDWAKEIPENLKDDPYHESEFLQEFLNNKAAELSGDEYRELTRKESTINSSISRIATTIKFLKSENVTLCPYCGAGATVPSLKKRIDELQGEKDELDQQKKENSAITKELETNAKELSRARRELEDAQNLLEEQREALPTQEGDIVEA